MPNFQCRHSRVVFRGAMAKGGDAGWSACRAAMGILYRTDGCRVIVACAMLFVECCFVAGAVASEALHSFSRFSAAGLSLLCPVALLSCSELPGSQLIAALRRPLDLFVAGLVTAPVRPFFFGARFFSPSEGPRLTRKKLLTVLVSLLWFFFL
jgi:hypothetical protein